MTELAPNGSGGYDNLGQTTYSYDSYGRSTGLTNSFNETTSVSYDSYSRPYRTDYPNGTYEVTTYDILNRPVTVTLKNSSNTVLNSRSYTYDAVGQITNITEGGTSKTYGYDEIGQLVSEPGISYTYDANGNRLTKTVAGTLAETYSYDAGDKLTSVLNGTGGTIKSYSYDAAGRTTAVSSSAGTTSFTYDYESRVKSIVYPNTTSDSYSYNAFDTRTGQTGVSGTKSFRRAGLGVTAPVLADGAARFTPEISERRGSASTFLNSGIKNTDVQTATSGAVSASRNYDAFGNLLAASGTWQGPTGYGGAFGYQEDANGIHLLGHRYYDSTTGRFLTRDPIRDGRNWYSYCENDPVNRTDPDGHMALALTWMITRPRYTVKLRVNKMGGSVHKETGHAWIDFVDHRTGEHHTYGLFEDGVAKDAELGGGDVPDIERVRELSGEELHEFPDKISKENWIYDRIFNSCVTFALIAWERMTGESITVPMPQTPDNLFLTIKAVRHNSNAK